jgi:hypothetical protein
MQDNIAAAVTPSRYIATRSIAEQRRVTLPFSYLYVKSNVHVRSLGYVIYISGTGAKTFVFQFAIRIFLYQISNRSTVYSVS